MQWASQSTTTQSNWESVHAMFVADIDVRCGTEWDACPQEPLITPDTPVDSGTVYQWLSSGDPRLIAWAADFARRRHEAQILAEMTEWLVHGWSLPLAYGKEGGQPHKGTPSAPFLTRSFRRMSRFPCGRSK
jgi:hypothetical protein